MTRNEARMIAEELYAIMEKNGNTQDEMMDVGSAASMMGCSTSFIYHNKETIPHFKVGKSLRFRRSDMLKYIREKARV